MPSGLLIRLRPTGPWRIGPDSGDRDRVDRIYHSDSLYSAVCSAMDRLGHLEAWLEQTAAASRPAVRFSSCFPFRGDTLYIVPPRNLWPPPPSSKVRWKGARFVPVSVVESLLAGRPVAEEGWMIDGASECLLPLTTPPAPGPFRVAVRSNAAVDRSGSGVTLHSTACLEFTPESGLWALAVFSGEDARERWSQPLTGAFRLLADSGFGGERARGWGRSEMPEITAGEVGDLLLGGASPAAAEPAYWVLSLFHPAASDSVDWGQGNYGLMTRGGRVESETRWGDPKRLTRMVTEGSVLIASGEPQGAATDVAPDGFPHPVYRAGYAVTIVIPARVETVRHIPGTAS
jgi:CRISPR type III-A-associated RAMP protein Csm4